MFSIFKKNKLIVFLFLLFCSPQIVLSYTSPPFTVSVSAFVEEHPPINNGSNGTGRPLNVITTINFSGVAYPFSKIYIFRDGKLATTTIADKNANFSASISGFITNTYNFSLYGEDSKGRKSSFFSIPIFITSGTTVNISNIYLSPTIAIDKIKIKRGDDALVFGKSNPKSEVYIFFEKGQQYIAKVIADINGDFSYNFNTTNIKIGSYQLKTKSILNNHTSSYSTLISFTVIDNENKNNETICSSYIGDLNCDNRVNLVDFSIMAYWYKKSVFPKKIDLNGDGKINLVDFSIMAFNWIE